MTAMLTCYQLWVPRRGVPKQCFATDALWGGGAACVPKRLYAILVVLTLTGT
jgi:hypothetical protein